MDERRNKSLAGLAAIVLPPIVASLTWMGLFSIRRSGFDIDENTALFVTIFFFPTALLATLFLGTSAYAVLYNSRIRGLWPLATAGFLTGAGIGWGCDIYVWPGSTLTIPYAVAGSLMAAMAWAIRRPDLDVDFDPRAPLDT